MRVIDNSTGGVLVDRDAAGSVVEVRIEGTAGEGPRVVRLSREEARRLAALVLFQAAKLDPQRAAWVVPYGSPIRRSA